MFEEGKDRFEEILEKRPRAYSQHSSGSSRSDRKSQRRGTLYDLIKNREENEERN